MKKKEYSEGNGQCLDCMGLDPKRYCIGGFARPPEAFGHHPHCRLAELMRLKGKSPVMLGEFKSNRRYKFSFNAMRWVELPKLKRK